MKTILLYMLLLSTSACDGTETSQNKESSKSKCPESDPLGLLETTPECESKTDNPLNLNKSVIPEILVKNLATIAEAASILEVCLISETYLQIDAELALQLHDMSSRLSDLVETVSDHYNNENLYFSYLLIVAKQSNDLKTIKFANDKFGPCSTALLSGLEKFTNQVEKSLPAPTK